MPFHRTAARPRIGSMATVESAWSAGSSVELLTMSFAPARTAWMTRTARTRWSDSIDVLLQMIRSAPSMTDRSAVEAVKPSDSSSTPAPAPEPRMERDATLFVPSPSRAILAAR